MLRAFGLLFCALRCLVGFGVCWLRFLGVCFLVYDFASAGLAGALCYLVGVCILQFVVSGVLLVAVCLCDVACLGGLVVCDLVLIAGVLPVDGVCLLGGLAGYFLVCRAWFGCLLVTVVVGLVFWQPGVMNCLIWFWCFI